MPKRQPRRTARSAARGRTRAPARSRARAAPRAALRKEPRAAQRVPSPTRPPRPPRAPAALGPDPQALIDAATAPLAQRLGELETRAARAEENLAFAERTAELLSTQLTDLLGDLTRLRDRLALLERRQDTSEQQRHESAGL